MLNNLLLDDRAIVLLPRLACLVGDRGAMFIQQIHYFNKDKGVDDDWFEASLEELHKKYFPFWTFIMVRRVKDRLVASNYIKTRKRRKTNGEHTLGYQVNKEKLFTDIADISLTKSFPLTSGKENQENPAPGGQSRAGGEKGIAAGHDIFSTHTKKERGTNHFPSTNSHSSRLSKIIRPDDVEEGLWQEFIAHRKMRRAPVSDRVIKMFREEAGKANITLSQAIEQTLFRGWQGFKAEWYLGNQQNRNNPPRVSPGQQGQIEYVDRI